MRLKQHDCIRHNKGIFWGYCWLNLILWAINSIITIRYIIKLRGLNNDIRNILFYFSFCLRAFPLWNGGIFENN